MSASTNYRRAERAINLSLQMEDPLILDEDNVPDNNTVHMLDDTNLWDDDILQNNPIENVVEQNILENPGNQLSDDEIMINILERNEETEYVTDTDSDSDSEDIDIADVGLKFVTWSSTFNISIAAVDNLLNWFREHHFPFLPKSIATLRKKAYTIDAPIRNLGTGSFFYFGLETIIKIFLRINHLDVTQTNNFELCFGIDGVPLSKSSSNGFWPILMKVKDYATVLPVGVFYGKGKPQSVQDYLLEFAPDLQNILGQGLTVDGVRVSFALYALVFDAQAKCFILDIVSPTGFNACPKCVCIGEKQGPRVVFPNLMAELRTDVSFMNPNDPIHRSTTLPPFATVGIDCITKTSIDYMHNVCQGVWKTVLNYWINTCNKPFSLTSAQKSEINTRIKTIKNQITSDFVRKPRPLEDLAYYKATELRQMLLYTGPFLFLHVVKREYYQHFLLLHCALRILCHPVHCITKNAQAEEYLQRFVNEFKFLYGTEYLVYNVHLLIHLAKECIHFKGPLDAFSAFPYENFLQKMVKMTKKAPKPLEQIRNRLQEQMYFHPERFYKWTMKVAKTERIPGTYLYEQIVTSNNIFFCIDSKDGFAFHGNKVFKIDQIKKRNNKFVLFCKNIKNLFHLYTQPLHSSFGGIFCTKEIDLCNEVTEMLAENASKVLHLQYNGTHVFTSLLHSEKNG